MPYQLLSVGEGPVRQEDFEAALTVALLQSEVFRDFSFEET
jgi:hypothetical protein